jgi:hypothetical protein
MFFKGFDTSIFQQQQQGKRDADETRLTWAKNLNNSTKKPFI